jgi:hypothetical protein
MYPIASYTFTSSGSTSFTNIPQIYTHLHARIFARSDYDRGAGYTQPVSIYLQFNGDGAANYSGHYFSSDGASITSSGGGANAGAYAGTYGMPSFRAPANIYSNVLVDIIDYTNTNKYKVVKSISGVDQNGTGSTSGAGSVSYTSSCWKNNNAITSILFYGDGNYVAGSRIDLYGITSSSIGTF